MPLLEGSSDDIIKKNIEELMSTGKYTKEQAVAIAYEKAGRKPKVNASEPTYEYLQAVWAILKERPDVFEDIKSEVHKTARASAGGTMKAKYAKEALDGKEKKAQGTMHMKTNASRYVSIRINGKEPPADALPGTLMSADNVLSGGSINLYIPRAQLEKDLPFDNYEVEDPLKFVELSKIIIAALGDVSPTGGILRDPENRAVIDKLIKNNGLRINASQFGGKVIEATDEITVIPAVLMAEGVRNGGLHRYEDFAQDIRWFEGVPIVPPHDPANPAASLVNQHTSKLGQIRNVKLNADKRRVEAEAVLFNSKFDPNDLARIQAGEAFGGSIGFWADDVPETGEWSDGTKYDRIEKNFFGNHFAIVSNPACPLGKCGFNVNSKIEANEMTETPKPVETPKVNAEVPKEAPKEVPKVNAEAPIMDLSVLIGKIDALSGDFSTFKANAEADKAEIARLKAAEDIRVNAQKTAEDALVLSTLDSLLLPAFKDKKAELFSAFKANAALFIAQNPDKIDLAAFTKPPVITPSGQAFVPHVNASEDEELKGLMPTDEEAGMRKVA